MYKLILISIFILTSLPWLCRADDNFHKDRYYIYLSGGLFPILIHYYHVNSTVESGGNVLNIYYSQRCMDLSSIFPECPSDPLLIYSRNHRVDRESYTKLSRRQVCGYEVTDHKVHVGGVDFPESTIMRSYRKENASVMLTAVPDFINEFDEIFIDHVGECDDG